MRFCQYLRKQNLEKINPLSLSLFYGKGRDKQPKINNKFFRKLNRFAFNLMKGIIQYIKIVTYLIRLFFFSIRNKCPENDRRIRKKSKEKWENYHVFCTNIDVRRVNIEYLAGLYRKRWNIENKFIDKTVNIPKNSSVNRACSKKYLIY